MPKWDKYLDDEEVEGTQTFEKFDKSVKVARRLLKRGDDAKDKEQLKRERDEKRALKRRDEV